MKKICASDCRRKPLFPPPKCSEIPADTRQTLQTSVRKIATHTLDIPEAFLDSHSLRLSGNAFYVGGTLRFPAMA